MVIMPGGIAIETGKVSDTLPKNPQDDKDTSGWRTSRKFGKPTSPLIKADRQDPFDTLGEGESTDRVPPEDTRMGTEPGGVISNVSLQQGSPDEAQGAAGQDSLPTMRHALPAVSVAAGLQVASVESDDDSSPEIGASFIRPDGKNYLQALHITPSREGEEILVPPQLAEMAYATREIHSEKSLASIYEFFRKHPEDESTRNFLQESHRSLFPRHLGYLSYEEMPPSVQEAFDAFCEVWMGPNNYVLTNNARVEPIKGVAKLTATMTGFSPERKAAEDLLLAISNANPKSVGKLFAAAFPIRFLLGCQRDSLVPLYSQAEYGMREGRKEAAIHFLGRKEDLTQVEPTSRTQWVVSEVTSQRDTQEREKRTQPKGESGFDGVVERRLQIRMKEELEIAKADAKEGETPAQIRASVYEKRDQFRAEVENELLAKVFIPAEERHRLVHGLSLHPDVASHFLYQEITPQGDMSGGDMSFLRELLSGKAVWGNGGLDERPVHAKDDGIPSITVIRPKDITSAKSRPTVVVVDGSLILPENEHELRVFFKQYYPKVKLFFNRGDLGITIAQAAFSQRQEDSGKQRAPVGYLHQDTEVAPAVPPPPRGSSSGSVWQPKRVRVGPLPPPQEEGPLQYPLTRLTQSMETSSLPPGPGMTVENPLPTGVESAVDLVTSTLTRRHEAQQALYIVDRDGVTQGQPEQEPSLGSPKVEISLRQIGRRIVAGSTRGEWIGMFGYNRTLRESGREAVGQAFSDGIKRTAASGVGFFTTAGKLSILRMGRPAGLRATQKAAIEVTSVLNWAADNASDAHSAFENLDRAFAFIKRSKTMSKQTEGVVAKVVHGEESSYLAVQQLNSDNPYRTYVSYLSGRQESVMRVSGRKSVVQLERNRQLVRQQIVLLVPPIRGRDMLKPRPSQASVDQQVDALVASLLRSGEEDIAGLFNAGLQRLFPGHRPVAVGVMKVVA